MDSSGEQHLSMDQNIHKRRLDLNGNPIEDPKKQEIATSTTVINFFSQILLVLILVLQHCTQAFINLLCTGTKKIYYVGFNHLYVVYK